MADALASLFDAKALIIVVAGTWLATLARCGWLDMAAAIRALGQLYGPVFDANANRAAMARSAIVIKERGPLCAETPLPPDPSLAKILASYLTIGSIDALRQISSSESSARQMRSEQGRGVFESAGELAPVFGLVGTLFAITQLMPVQGTGTGELALAAVGTAVLSSLYGVLTAQFLYLPLARAIERRSEREERARSDILEFFESEIAGHNARRSGKLRPAA